MIRIITFCCCIALFFCCYHRKPEAPAHFPFPVKDICQINSKEASLGEILFYEPALSSSNKISCASCHQPSRAFADSLNFSVGAGGKKTFRNTPSLANLAWETSFFLDGGAPSLERQAIAPIVSHQEMNENFANIINKLNSKEQYKDKFREVYGSDSITGLKIVYAIAAFERTLISSGSAYDNYLTGKQPLTTLQNKGLSIFEKKCAQCHAGVLFTDNNFHNIGLDSVFPSMSSIDDPLLGRARITRRPEDMGKYRTPSLRNISLTGPYIHDGRFTTIMEVLNHYSSAVKETPYTDSLLLKDGARGILLSMSDKEALLSFLLTLTDSAFAARK